jgi:hypothetical protein
MDTNQTNSNPEKQQNLIAFINSNPLALTLDQNINF